MSASSLSLRWHLMAVGAFAALMFAHFSVAVPSLVADARAAAAAAEQQRDLATLENVKIAMPATEKIVMTRGQAVIAAVPEEARGSFILYQLAEALNDTNSRSGQPLSHARFAHEATTYHKEAAAFKSVPVYDNFSKDLLHWTMQHFGLTETDIYGLLRNRSMYCTANGVCYSQEDISCVCCPF